jgi:hypothetical protein
MLLGGLNYVVNTGEMTIFGLDFGAGHETELKI